MPAPTARNEIAGNHALDSEVGVVVLPARMLGRGARAAQPDLRCATAIAPAAKDDGRQAKRP
eukprot:2354121-Alexandrium_andersonii.AAC.1